VCHAVRKSHGKHWIIMMQMTRFQLNGFMIYSTVVLCVPNVVQEHNNGENPHGDINKHFALLVVSGAGCFVVVD